MARWRFLCLLRIKNDAQDYLNKVFNSSTSEELLNLLEQVKKSSFLSYRVEAKK